MAVDLTDAEVEFLSRHNLSERDVFDWRGYSSSERADALKKAGKTLALGAPCIKGSHRLRTRAGHCVQCDPAKIAYQSRKSARSVLYAAYSENANGFKVGISQEPKRRISALNREAYGGFTDWLLYMARELKDAGQSEAAIHRSLSEYEIVGSYQKGSHKQKSREIFCCSSDTLIRAFLTGIKTDQIITDGYSKPPPKLAFPNGRASPV